MTRKLKSPSCPHQCMLVIPMPPYNDQRIFPWYNNLIKLSLEILPRHAAILFLRFWLPLQYWSGHCGPGKWIQKSRFLFLPLVCIGRKHVPQLYSLLLLKYLIGSVQLCKQALSLKSLYMIGPRFLNFYTFIETILI